MIDLHSHILPGLDDGAQTLGDALAMARMAVRSGITAVAATPHCADDRVREVTEAWQLLREALDECAIPLRLYPGMEIFGTPDTAAMLRRGQLLTINGSPYPLIEFSFGIDGDSVTRILQSVCAAGFVPIVAHPERYSYVRHDPELINRWHRMGCRMQINRSSLLGRFGAAEQDMAGELVDRGFATVIASDAHSARMRTPWMEDIRTLLRREYSPMCARLLLLENPRAILKGEQLPPVEPEWF